MKPTRTDLFKMAGATAMAGAAAEKYDRIDCQSHLYPKSF